jgi:hypothetical protein
MSIGAAEREPDPELPLPRETAGEHQPRDVDARDQEDHAGDPREDRHRFLERPAHRIDPSRA